MANTLLALAALLQAVAVVYGIVLLRRRQGAAAAWLFLLGAMASMLAWRVTVLFNVQPPPFFNPAIAIWGSTCMLAAMYFFGREGVLRRKVEIERDALLASERVAREVAERASDLKDDFLATVSHELRTPLSVILSWCAVIKTGKVGKAEADKAFEVIERNARLQTRLVDDLLDATRLQAGSLHLDLRPVSLESPVRSAIQSVTPAAEAKNQHISLTVPPAPLLVMGDPARLQQIAGNLLTNAIKFTDTGGRIELSIEQVENFVRLQVRDNGEGMDAAFLPRLFGRFQQADSSTTRHQRGLGLGLSIVANLARLHGGRVEAVSAGKGLGSTFTVFLPVVTPPATKAADVLVNDTTPPELHGARILLIDDEADVREATSALLRRLGGEVQALASPRDVLDAIDAFQPHVVIVDIGMPDEDGYSVMRRIRAHLAGGPRQIPAISLTAHAREEDRKRALDAGFVDHLHKPIDVVRLASTIRQLAGVSAPAAR